MTPRELFETRRLEVFIAGSTTAFGFWIAMPFDSMATAAFLKILNAAPELTWGLFFLFNGFSHVFALLINGRRWWSPFIRWFAALSSGLAYAGFCVGFIAQNWQTTAVPIYASLSVGAGICLYFAWLDARLALGVRYAAGNAR